MIYTLEQLKSLILPIVQSMPIAGEIKQDGSKLELIVKGDAAPVVDAIIEIIKQDREANAAETPHD